MPRLARLLAAALVLPTLGGCLLPQPDTPILPPAAAPNRAAPGSAVKAPNAESTAAGSASAAPTADTANATATSAPPYVPNPATTGSGATALAPTQPGRLDVRFMGASVAIVRVYDDMNNLIAEARPATDTAVLEVKVAGDYWLDLVIGGETLRAKGYVTIPPVEVQKQVEARIEGRTVTIEETLPLVPRTDPTPSQAP